MLSVFVWATSVDSISYWVTSEANFSDLLSSNINNFLKDFMLIVKFKWDSTDTWQCNLVKHLKLSYRTTNCLPCFACCHTNYCFFSWHSHEKIIYTNLYWLSDWQCAICSLEDVDVVNQVKVCELIGLDLYI